MLARLDTNKDLDEEGLNYLQDIPNEYKLLFEFLSQAYESRYLPTSLKRALISIGKNINMIDTEAIQNEFNKTGEGKQHIAVFLYEDFLQAYDNLKKTEKRKESGVYYTPAEATNFITRSVNEIIKTKFDLQDGYLADKIKILDFACGTGTFLHSVFEEMLENNTDALRKEIIRNKIENDIYGFELLFVPYIISHTILTRFLKENGINLQERLGIFLTNTLDISQHSISSLLPNLKKEYEKAMDVKDKEHILAIIGNPPYFDGKSQSINDVIDTELYEYKKDLNERKFHIDDLYIKFIRFAEWKIEKQKQGVIGIITNNGYLDGLTSRQMRNHLYDTFDEIYILNLHGNVRKRETDKNIFDIMQGVAIVIFVKLPKKTTKKTVKYFSTMDNNIITRSQKLDFLQDTKFKNVKWKPLKPVEPYYWFVDKDTPLQNEYSKFLKLTNIFNIYGSGIATGNDNLTIQYNKKQLENIVDDFKNISIEKIKTKYRLEKYDLKNEYWTVKKAQESLESVNFDKKFIKPVLYKPFDNRFTFLHEKSGFLIRPLYNIMQHFTKENIGLIFPRSIEGSCTHGFISDCIIDNKCGGAFSGRETRLAPLYLYQDGDVFDNANRTPNFTVEFTAFLKTLDFKPIPEKILAYIYATLHSPIYRKKYIEFLKTDFPAIPFTKDKTIFEKYAKLGQKLIDLHLLKNIPKDNTIKISNIPPNDFIIDKITYIDNKLLLQTTENKIITIEGITKEIYDFEIGSYKPIDKWLKYRKKDSVPLNSKDLKHIKDMAVAIKNTIAIMQEIENLGEEYLI
jgi:predicted helicase